jgi:methionyl-tRNA formyltransferase
MARIVFFGTPEFALPVLQSLLQQHTVLAVVTQPDRAAGRGRQRLAAPPVKELAATHGVEVMQPQRLRRAAATLRRLAELQADVFVLAAYGQILPATVLAMAPHGCLGVHASLLPALRGAAPISAAILQGLAETGITLMLTDVGMDTGPIIAQAALAIAPQETTATLTPRLAKLGADLLIATLPAWLRGEITPQPQDERLATVAPMIAREDAAIDWRQPAIAIERQVRAYDPWPGAYTLLAGQTLKIISAVAELDTPADAPPGAVLALPQGIAVATGAGVLRLGQVQLAGKRAMPALELARGYRGLVGTVLESAMR